MVNMAQRNHFRRHETQAERFRRNRGAFYDAKTPEQVEAFLDQVGAQVLAARQEAAGMPQDSTLRAEIEARAAGLEAAIGNIEAGAPLSTLLDVTPPQLTKSRRRTLQRQDDRTSALAVARREIATLRAQLAGAPVADAPMDLDPDDADCNA